MNNSTHNSVKNNTPILTTTNVRSVFKLGLDVDLRNIVVAIQCDQGTLKPAQKLSRPQLIGWVKEQVAAGHAVYTVYECCGFRPSERGQSMVLTYSVRRLGGVGRKANASDGRPCSTRTQKYVNTID